MTSPPILVGSGWAVKLALLLALSAAGAVPERLLLTDSMGAVDGWTRLPDLTQRAYQPDVLLTSGSRTLTQAVTHLAAAVVAQPPADGWLRLDTIDLTAVGDCETCQPPPLDPHRYQADQPPPRLQPRQYEFFDQAAAALVDHRLNLYVIVPPNSPLPASPHPDLWFFLASPPLALEPNSLAARRSLWEAWRALTARVFPLVTDGLDELVGLPRGGALLHRQLDALPAAAVVLAEPDRLNQRVPAVVEQRIEDVLLEQARAPQADVYRLDRPDLARLLDIYLQCRQALAADGDAASGRALARLADLDRLAAWDRARSAGDPVAGWEVPDEFGLPLQRLVAGAEPLSELELPAIVPPRIDAWQGAGEWSGAASLELVLLDDGEPSSRPATVRLAADETWLYVAVVATEPNPAEASLRDRVVLVTSPAGVDGPLLELALAVDGTAVQREALPYLGRFEGAQRVLGAEVAATFDGPGWVLEARVPRAALGWQGVGPWRANLWTEHRAGRERWVTVWQPTGGGLHHPLRLARLRLER